MKTTETVTLPLFFCFFSSGVAVLFSTTFCTEMQCRFFFAVFINCQCFVCAVIFHRVFCLLVVQLFMRFCFFRKNFQYAVARCVGYFSTTFCTEMQCRFFFAVFINCQCFVCAVIFHRVFCLLVVQLFMRFCFFRKNFQYAVARCVGYFSTTFCAEMQCRCFFAVFISFQCFVCAVIFHRVFCLFVVPLHLRFCFSRKFCVFVCKLSGRLSEKVPRLGSLLVSTVCLV